jgi:hypothetical protein
VAKLSGGKVLTVVTLFLKDNGNYLALKKEKMGEMYEYKYLDPIRMSDFMVWSD